MLYLVLWHSKAHLSLKCIVRISNMQNKSKKLNKRPMGHIAHLRKQFKSINTYGYIITLIKRRKKPLLSL